MSGGKQLTELVEVAPNAAEGADVDAGAAERSLGVAVARALEAAGLLPKVAEPGGPTLNDYVDVEALEALFAPQLDGTPRAEGQVVFECRGARVTVHSDGRVVVRDADAETDAEATSRSESRP